jgi:ABC-2 type transport system permease protein
MLDVMARGQGPARVLPEIGILLGFALVLSVLASRVPRWGDIWASLITRAGRSGGAVPR